MEDAPVDVEDAPGDVAGSDSDIEESVHSEHIDGIEMVKYF